MSLSRTTTLTLRSAARQSTSLQTRSRVIRQSGRFNSTQAGANANAGTHPAVAGAAAGAAAAILVGYGAYKYTGVDKAVATYTTTKSYLSSATDKLKEATPEPNQALDALKGVALHYAQWIPGGKGYVEGAFRDVDKIREKHGDEVNKIVSDTYSQLKKTADAQGLSLETASQSYTIIQDALSKISSLAIDASQEILDNHPKLKEQVGGSVGQLKELGEKYGSDAKKQVDDVWKQVSAIVAGGLSLDSVGKVKKLIEEKTKELSKLGDAAWSKGLEQAKPYLDKSPQIKELLEKNKDALINGDLKGLWEKVKAGDLKDVESFVKENAEKAKDKANEATGGGLDKYLGMIPGIGELSGHFGKIQDIASKRGPEAEKLLKQTMEDIKEVLAKRAGEAEKLGEKAKKDATS